MQTKFLPFIGVLALIGTLVGCGGGQDAEDNAPAADSSRDTAMSAARDQGRDAGNSDDSMQDAAESASGQMDSAGERAARMAGEASERAQGMVDEAGEQAREMASEAGERAEQMAGEASDRAEQAMAAATSAMGSEGSGQAARGDSGDPCVVNVEVGDSIAYSVDSISVPSSCDSVTINLDHTGTLPKAAMGHNWVLVPAAAVQNIGMAGMSVGLESDYLPDDDRIVAATDLIGGGESTSVTFSLDDLDDGTEYAYVCTFPGHWSAMRGTFSVE